MSAKLENSAVAKDQKRSVFIPIPKQGNVKESSNCYTVAFISHASKVTLNILQAGFQQYMSRELLHVQTGFRKGRGTGDQIGSSRKQESSRTSTFVSLTTLKPLTVWTITNCGKFFKR